MVLKIAVIGRPNVGKSTLFNRLVGKKQALVDNIPGLTRDRKEGDASIGPLKFKIIDTAGLEKAENNSLESLMMIQTEAAAEEADILFMVIDAREGITAMDEHFASWVRKLNKPTILLANKCEGNKISAGIGESVRLGLGDPVSISAEHGDGFAYLYDAIEEMKEKYNIADDPEEEIDEEQIQIAIVGRPNAGKSTFFNALLGEERSIASPLAGTTRDSVYIDWYHKGQNIKLVDTAGLRKRAKRHGRLEKLSVNDSFAAIQYSNIVILMLDATQAFDKIDMTLLDHIHAEGRGVVVVANKWDLVKDKKAVLEQINEKLEYVITKAKGAPVVTISAIDGKNVEKVIAKAMDVFSLWNKRVGTGKLNRWLEEATSAHIPPLSNGKRIKFKYATQAKTRPPTFILFTSSNMKSLPDSYLRYLQNSIKEHFGFYGIPVRLIIRKSENPYEKK